MKLWSFCLLTALALLFAGLTVVETLTYRRWEQALDAQKDIQVKMNYFQNVNRVLDSLMHRMAYDSLRDPALAQMLKDHKIKVVVTGLPPANGSSGTEATTNLSTPSNSGQPSPDTSATPPTGATQSHP